MKVRLNIICVLIFTAIVLSFANSIRSGVNDFLVGYEDGRSEHPLTTYYLTLKPDRAKVFSDSIYNEKSNAFIPMQYRDVTVKSAPNDAFYLWLIFFITALIVLVAGVMQLYAFCKFVVAINRSVIFERSNVRYLRMMAYSILVVFVLNLLVTILYHNNATSLIELSNYRIVWMETIEVFQLILGLSILLIAEAFAVGIRLRQEQELTI